MTHPEIEVALTIRLDGAAAAPSDIPAELQAQLVRMLARRFPYGGNKLEAALREATARGWRARHALAALHAATPDHDKPNERIDG